jgi:hypothetical protein
MTDVDDHSKQKPTRDVLVRLGPCVRRRIADAWPTAGQ